MLSSTFKDTIMLAEKFNGVNFNDPQEIKDSILLSNVERAYAIVVIRALSMQELKLNFVPRGYC